MCTVQLGPAHMFFNTIGLLYNDPDRVHTAKANLCTLCQGRQAAEQYCSEFRRWDLDSTWNDPEFPSQFGVGGSLKLSRMFWLITTHLKL